MPGRDSGTLQDYIDGQRGQSDLSCKCTGSPAENHGLHIYTLQGNATAEVPPAREDE